MNETGFVSNWRKWKVDTDNLRYDNERNYNKNENPTHSPRLNPLNASNSQSDPSYSKRRSHFNSNKDYPDLAVPANHNKNNGQAQGQSNSRQAACHFRGPEGNRPSSYTEGFSHYIEDEEDAAVASCADEPTDILVWNNSSPSPTTKRRQYPRSLSDTVDKFSVPIPSSHKPFITPKTNSAAKFSKSISLRSLNRSISVVSGESNGEYEDKLAAVTEQLEMIKTTQDSILSELSSDISTLQFENVQLKNTNEHLTMQNSHLLHVVTDLSNEVELMRKVFRSKGWPIHKEDDPRSIIDILKEGTSTKTDTPKITKDNKQQVSMKRRPRNNNLNNNNKMHENSYEEIPLNPRDTSSCILNKTKKHYDSSGPGDDQVLSLSNRSAHKDLSSKDKKKKHHKVKPKPETKSSDYNNVGEAEESSSEDKAEGSCFKGLFKRKKKQSQHQHHRHSHHRHRETTDSEG